MKRGQTEPLTSRVCDEAAGSHLTQYSTSASVSRSASAVVST